MTGVTGVNPAPGRVRPDPAAPVKLITMTGIVAPAGPGVLEIGEFAIRDGHEDAFLAAYLDVREVLATTPGCRSVRMTKGIESPTRFVVLVEWDSVGAHEQNFRGTERFTRWRAALSPHFADAPHVEHVTDADA